MSECVKEITVSDEEFERVLAELQANRDAIKMARELSDESFRFWLLETLRDIASEMGLVIVGLKEFVFDVGYAVKSGWRDGARQAKANSYREKDRRKK